MRNALCTRAMIVAGFAAASALSAPAGAVDRPGLAQAGTAASVTVHRGSLDSPRFVSGNRFDRRFDRRRGVGDFGYIAVPEYQGDSAFRSEGFNDWWHSRPDRNEPRWLRSNNCERQYWTGGGWRC